jgi:DHA3 family macrolide efflux protein-like MFS transporter
MAFSIGMIAGGALIAARGKLKDKIKTIAAACMVVGAATAALGMIPVFWIYLLFMGLIGVAIPFLNTPTTVLIQETADPDFLGRVFGVVVMISTSMMPLGMLVFGPLADIVRIERLLVGTGLFMFALSFFIIGNKVLVEAGKPLPKTETAE